MNSCFLIGGDGFIGRNLVTRFLGQRNITVVSRSPLKSRLPDDVGHIVGDLSSDDVINRIVEDADEIIYLAHPSKPSVVCENLEDEISAGLPNLISLCSNLARSKKLEKFIYVSSGGTVYGNAKYLPIDESHPTNPISAYGIAKLTAEKLAYMFFFTQHLPLIIVRPGNVYGIGKDGIKHGLIGTLVSYLINNKQVTIYGDGSIVRDYIYMSDVADALLCVLRAGKIGEVYNLGYGEGKQVNEVIDLIIEAHKPIRNSMDVEYLESRTVDVQKNVLDINKIESDTGWRPKITLEMGVEILINYEIDRVGRFDQSFSGSY